LCFPGLALNQSLNRLACTLSGCCYGRPFSFGILFPKGAPSSIFLGQGTRVFPSQPLESAFAFGCCVLLLVLIAKNRPSLHLFPLLWGLAGFFLEFVCADDRGRRLWVLSGFQQLAYLALMAVGIFFLFKTKEAVYGKPAKCEPAD
jgi:prolipoprotein diacylglyceryltransferase